MDAGTNKPARDAKGRLLPGHTANPNGRPRRQTELRQLLEGAATDERVLAVFSSIERKALEGDMTAAKLFLEYTVGKPKESVEIESGGQPLVFNIVSAKKRKDEDDE